MAVLTASERAILTNAMPANAMVNLGQRLADAGSLMSAGRVATGHIRVGTNAVDTDTVTIAASGATRDGVFVPGSTVTYEFETTGGVTAGNIQVTPGGTAALTATALAAAVGSAQGGVVRAVAHATNTTVVDVAHQVPGGTLTITTSSGGRLLVQSNAEGLAKGEVQLYTLRRTVTAEDVTRGRIRLDTGLTTLLSTSLRLLTSATDQTVIPYNGTLSTTGGVVELPQGTAGGVFAANHILDVTAFGTV